MIDQTFTGRPGLSDMARHFGHRVGTILTARKGPAARGIVANAEKCPHQRQVPLMQHKNVTQRTAQCH